MTVGSLHAFGGGRRIRRTLVSVIVVTIAAMVILSASSAATSTGGAKLWVKRFSGPGMNVDVPSSIATAPDGSTVFVTGKTAGAVYDPNYGSDYYVTAAYDHTTGATLWLRRYKGPQGCCGSGTVGIAVSSDGSRVFVTGTSTEAYATIAYDAEDGATLWVRRYDVDAADEAAAIATYGSAVFVTGHSFRNDGTSVSSTVAYDVITGAKLWVKQSTVAVSSIAASPDGSRVFIIGTILGDFFPNWGYNVNYATIAYRASTGAQLWLRRYKGPQSSAAGANDFPYAVVVNADGTRVFVTGESEDDYLTVAYDASTGGRVWVSRYDVHSATGSFDTAVSITATPDGSKLFVTGRSVGPNPTFDYVTVAYNASTGGKLWSRFYNGPAKGDDQASSITTDGSKVFVTGQSEGIGSGNDYATVAYDATTGSTFWARRYNAAANGDDSSSAITISPDGSSVFVTGYSTGISTGKDWNTIAYAP
jgi:lipocalin